MQRVVVVGAGLAGARACAALREQGYAGDLTLVGAERHRPYDRPPLSKELLRGEVDDTTLDVPLEGVDLRLGCRAVGLSRGALHTDAGDLAWDGLVLATGADPVRLPGDGAQLVIRTVDDARALRARLRPGARVAIVGAGWIGAEVATAALAAGCAVTVLEAGPAPLAHALGAEVGGLTLPWWSDVDLRLGVVVEAVVPGGLALAAGPELAADVVVTAVGVRPATGWLAGSGLALDRGVVVDAHLAASWPGVVAVGDCAAWWSRRFGRLLRVEHWDDALHAPTVAAATLLRPSPTRAVHDPVPYVWSDQFGRLLQYAGERADADATLLRGDPAGEGFGVAWLAAGRLVAFLAVDRPRDLLQARKAIAADAEPDPTRLADPAVSVRDAVAP